MASRAPFKDYFEILYSRVDAALDESLRALLPPSLSDAHVAALGGTSFLTPAGLERLEEACFREVKGARHMRSSPPRILDLGCGRGQLGNYLSDSVGGVLVGVDFAGSAVRVAQSKLGSSAFLLQADFLSLPFAPGSFDLILAIDCLHLCASPMVALAEIRRVLHGNGSLVGSVYSLPGSSFDETPQSWWKQCFYALGFKRQRWTDVTTEWRREMFSKHRLRWAHRERLISLYGDRAHAECQVSCRMLGLDGKCGFIDMNSRWEFVAAAC